MGGASCSESACPFSSGAAGGGFTNGGGGIEYSAPMPYGSSAAALATAALTATLASILTHAVITGRVVLPPGLSNLGALFARILPGSDYRRTTTVDESPHRGDWTWAQPHRKEGTPRGISGTSSGQVSTPASGYGSM